MKSTILDKIIVLNKKNTQSFQKTYQKLHDRIVLENTERCLAEPLIDNDGTKYIVAELIKNAQRTDPLDNINKKLNIKKNNVDTLYKPIKCYICKEPFVNVHRFYHKLCSHCADYNFNYRTQTTDLTGRVALVTGGRIKIGFEIALKLLRAGANVLVTTRFVQDALSRYRKQADFAVWQHNLTIYGLDLKNINTVENFNHYLQEHYSALDIIINNASQTLRKHDSYYQQMAVQEQHSLTNNPESIQKLLGNFKDKKLQQTALAYLQSVKQPSLDFQHKQVNSVKTMLTDEFAEPIDFNHTNSWKKRLDEIDTLEFMEAQVINATAPFLLNSRLKSLLIKSPFPQRFIINVSAMEGQFNREDKTHTHVHTNMAKAAVNMLTRTVSQDYAKDNIFMNSVDTGWVTQENPFYIKQHSRLKGMVPPLDCIDGASRVLAPIFDCLNSEHTHADYVDKEAKNNPIFGQFLKDYHVCAW